MYVHCADSYHRLSSSNFFLDVLLQEPMDALIVVAILTQVARKELQRFSRDVRSKYLAFHKCSYVPGNSSVQ